MQIQLFVPGLWKAGNEKIKAHRETLHNYGELTQKCAQL